MKRTKLSDRTLPNYTKGEEITNMITHIVGGVLGIVALILCVVFAAKNQNVYGIISGTIFGVSIITLYAISSIYHGLSPKLFSKKILQVLDHCFIFVLIAGTCTPIVLCNIRNLSMSAGWWLFGIVWAVAVLGIILNAIDLKKYNLFSQITYILLGFCIAFRVDLLVKGLVKPGIILLVIGGGCYIIGSVLYGLGQKYKYMHSVFHIFTLIGTLLHFFCILLYAM